MPSCDERQEFRVAPSLRPNFTSLPTAQNSRCRLRCGNAGNSAVENPATVCGKRGIQNRMQQRRGFRRFEWQCDAMCAAQRNQRSTETTTMRPTHDHHSSEGLQALAEACIAEATRRKRPELAGDFFCKAHHESRDDRRSRYTARQIAWQAGGHVLSDLQRRADRTPELMGGEAIGAVSGTDRGDTFTRQMEFAYDLYNAIGAQLAVQRVQLILASPTHVDRALTTSRPPMPPVQLAHGPLARRIRNRRATTLTA